MTNNLPLLSKLLIGKETHLYHPLFALINTYWDLMKILLQHANRGQQANCFLCGLESIWLSTLVHKYHLKQYCSQDACWWRHTHIFLKGLCPLLWRVGGSSPLTSLCCHCIGYASWNSSFPREIIIQARRRPLLW